MLGNTLRKSMIKSTDDWHYVNTGSGLFINLSCDEKLPILSNGKRYKKDSREWLHKSSDKKDKRKQQHFKMEQENDSEDMQTVCVEMSDVHEDIPDHRIYTCMSMPDARMIGHNPEDQENSCDTSVKSTYSCLNNVKPAKPIVYPDSGKRKRRHTNSPVVHFQVNDQCYEDENNNIIAKEDIQEMLVKKYGFAPIPAEVCMDPREFHGLSDSGSPKEVTLSESFGILDIDESSFCWRDAGRIRSDPSSPGSASTPDEDLLRSPVFSPVPIKKHKSFHNAVEFHPRSLAEDGEEFTRSCEVLEAADGTKDEATTHSQGGSE